MKPTLVFLSLALTLTLSPLAHGQRLINSHHLRGSSMMLEDINNTGANTLLYASQDCAGLDCFNPDDLALHALDPSANPPYSSELPGFPKVIALAGDIYGDNNEPTPSAGDINFSRATDPQGYMSVAVGGGGVYGYAVNVFRCTVLGTPGDCHAAILPGFPHDTNAPPIWNAFVVRSASLATEPPPLSTVDGSPALLVADESCYLYRFNGLGTLRHCQFIASSVWSSPALGYALPHSGMADGTPNEIGAGFYDYSGMFPQQVKTFDSWGKSLDCQGAEDLISPQGNGEYTSSPALADLDRDGKQDIVIADGLNNMLEAFTSSQGIQTFQLTSGPPDILPKQWASPAIVSFDGVHYDTIVAADDGGYVHALKYDPVATPHLSERQGWPRLLDGTPVQASPLVAQLQPDPSGPQIVAATLGGKVYVLTAAGTDLVTPYQLGSGSNAPIRSTPAVGTRHVNLTGDTCSTTEPTNCPIIVAGNLFGAWEIVLSNFPPYNPATAQWPTFHRGNRRTGALTPDQDSSTPTTPTYGSVGGVGPGCTDVKLLYDSSGTIVPDYYGGDSDRTPLSDGRYLFEFVRAKDDSGNPIVYRVRFNNSFDVTGLTVNAGQLTISNHTCP